MNNQEQAIAEPDAAVPAIAEPGTQRDVHAWASAAIASRPPGVLVAVSAGPVIVTMAPSLYLDLMVETLTDTPPGGLRRRWTPEDLHAGGALLLAAGDALTADLAADPENEF